jgi:predicted HicB family RNase H-like nuclease
MTKRKPKPRVGRPSKGDAGLSRVFSIKISEDIHATWTAAAEREGLSLSEWLRAAAELAIARGSTR